MRIVPGHVRGYTRLFLLICAVLGCGCAAVQEREEREDTYLIVEAYVKGSESKQPAWLVFRNERSGFRINTGYPIYYTPSGEYALTHFGFRDGWIESFSIDNRRRGLTNFLPNVIYFIGVIELEQTRQTPVEYDVNLVSDERLLQRACIFRRDLFEKYTLRFPYSDTPEKDFKIRCE